jgi:surface antigen
LRRLFFLSAAVFVLGIGTAQAEIWWLEGARPAVTIPAAIIGPKDDREWLTPDVGQKFGLSAAEVIRIQDSTGFVACRGSLGSGALVIDNEHIVTAIHVIVDRSDAKNKKFREDCAFVAHDVNKRYVRHRLILKESSYIAGTLDVDRDRSGDWAIIKLERPVPRGVPFALGDERVWRIGNQIVMLSSNMSDKPNPMDKDNPGLPIAQKCMIRHLARGLTGRIFLSDCDSKSGASGGVSIMRLDGDLVLAGIVVGNSGKVDFQPYGPKNFTASISVADGVVNAIFRLGAKEIRASAHQKNALLAGEIGDELDEASRLLAHRTEIQALNTLAPSLRWKSKTASGYVLTMTPKGTAPAANRCRSFTHAIVYGPDRTKAAKGKACRGTNGAWSIVIDLADEVQSPSQGAGAPPYANAGPERRERPSSQSR